MLGNLNFDLIKYTLPNYKLDKDLKVVLVADLHGYCNNEFRRNSLADQIKQLNPHHIMIAGDIIQGSEWENSKAIKNFKYFLENLREVCPVFISLGNHDLIGNNKNNHDRRIYNFKKLGDKNIYPLHEDKVIYDGFEIVGITPSFSLAAESFNYPQESLHKKYVEEISDKIEIDDGYIVEFLGHDPNMMFGKDLGLLEKCDFIYAGHLHNGYYASNIVKRNPDKYLEYGFVEKLLEKNEFGKIKSIYPFIVTKCDLVRGVIYFDNNGNKKYLQLRNGHYYKYSNNEWHLCDETEVVKNELHALIITGGIKKFSYFSNIVDLPEITEVNYVGKKYCK